MQHGREVALEIWAEPSDQDKLRHAMESVKHEFRLDNGASLNVGDVLKADTFAEGDHG